MATSSVLLEITDDGVARLTLNRPEAANAIDLDLARVLAEAAETVRASDDVRAVLVRGRGDRFCGGGDVRAFASAKKELPDRLEAIVRELHRAIEALAAVPAPIVVAVHGSAAGAGLSLVALADLVLAAESTKFVMAYTAIGLTPDGGCTWYLPRAIGLRRALDLTLTNRVLDAQEASAWGLVTRVVPDDALEHDADALVAQLAAGPTHAFARAKRLLYGSLEHELHDQLEREAEELVASGGHGDGQEGVAAFVEKRPPSFDGR